MCLAATGPKLTRLLNNYSRPLKKSLHETHFNEFGITRVNSNSGLNTIDYFFNIFIILLVSIIIIRISLAPILLFSRLGYPLYICFAKAYGFVGKFDRERETTQQ